MAAVILKRAPNTASKLLEHLFFKPGHNLAPSSSAVRSFNANAQMSSEGDSTERPSNIAHRRSDSLSRRRPGGLSRRRFRRGDDEYPTIFSDVFDPFNPSRSLSQVLNMVDQMMNVIPDAGERGWDAREDDDALHLRVDMPGLDKEHVKVSVEGSTLIIHGEGEETEEQGEDSRRRYRSRIDLPEDLYKMDGIKAEMKNGVLKVTVPKVKEEERRRDVHQVQIE